jgi:hypothetical protein
MSYCPQCKATLGAKRLKCTECGHERQPEPELDDQADGEPKGWAAAYASRQPGNNAERMAAQLRQWSEGNFTGASPLRVPGLSSIWRKGWQ